MPKWAKELQPSSGNVARINQRRDAARRVPTVQDVMDLPPADAGVYMLTGVEIKKLRSRVYALNKDNHYGWRWRTLVEPGRGRHHQLLIWRIH